MMPSARLIGIGVFVLGGCLLFAVALFMIGDRRLMFAEQFHVHADFAEISGLQQGAPVRVRGMEAGEVTAVTVPATPAGRFTVRMRVREDLRPLVRIDSVASIQTDGLVGSRFVKIDAGSENQAVVSDGGTIKSREPFDFADVLQRAGDTVDQIGEAVVDLRADLNQVVATIGETATNANEVVKAVGPNVEAIGRSGRRISEDTSRILEGIRAGRGTIGRLVNDDELYGRTRTIARDAEEMVRIAREGVSEARGLVAKLQGDLKSGEGPVRSTVDDLRTTVASTREVMANLAETTEAFKRNFLIRGYFEDRGYYNLNELTASDYREGGLAGRYREPIRIWLRADLLFEPSPPAGSAVSRPGGGPGPATETLSSSGRIRLDLAMAEVLRYPRTSPLVIEAYALADTRDARVLRAAGRARQVHDYLVVKYALAPTQIRMMPLDGKAEGSPQADQWDGVALAVWVDRRVFDTSSGSQGR